MKKVKGFTLIELIIVMATFSIVLFGALQLMDPVQRIFNKSYNAEDISASATNMLNYIDAELRYAEHIRVMTTKPTQADLVQFVDLNYDGKIVPKGSGITDFDYASGKMYVLELDNANGGIINKWEMDYTAGDSKIPTVHDSSVTKPDYAIDPVVSGYNPATPTVAVAVNRSMYDNAHFNFSLGNYVFDTAHKLARNNDFYTKYTDVHMQAFSRSNFGLTLTAYSYSNKGGTETVGRTAAAVDDTDQRFTYGDNAFIFNKNIGLLNAKDPISGKPLYYKYNWDSETEVKKAATGEDAGKYTLTDSYDQSAGNNSQGLDISAVSALSNEQRAELPQIYFVYTYSGGDVK